MSAGTIVSLVIGTWGAVVATILGVRELRRDRRVVRVACETIWGKGRGGGDELFVRVRITNEGHRPVEPRHVFFLTRDGRRVPFPDKLSRGQPQPNGYRQLPRLLGDGQTVVVDFETRDLDEAAKRIGLALETVEVQSVGGPFRAPYPRY